LFHVPNALEKTLPLNINIGYFVTIKAELICMLNRHF
jgi:hypothetical protein